MNLFNFFKKRKKEVLSIQAVNAIAWIKALLSGKYKQTKQVLGSKKEGFCCWGLGCYITKTDYNPLESWNFELYENIGFNSKLGFLGTPLNGFSDLADVNDATDTTFKEIGQHLITNAETEFIPDVAAAIKKHFNT